MKSIAERIHSLRTAKGLSQIALSKLVGTSPPQISQWESGKYAPNASATLSLAKALETTVEFLQHGTEPAPHSRLKRLPVAEIPVLGSTQAGEWREMILDPDHTTITIPKEYMGKDRFALQVEGDSMSPAIAEGAHVIIDPHFGDLQHGKIYLVKNAAGGSTVKRIKLDGADIYLVPDNPIYSSKPAPDGGDVIGRVVATFLMQEL